MTSFYSPPPPKLWEGDDPYTKLNSRGGVSPRAAARSPAPSRSRDRQKSLPTALQFSGHWCQPQHGFVSQVCRGAMVSSVDGSLDSPRFRQPCGSVRRGSQASGQLTKSRQTGRTGQAWPASLSWGAWQAPLTCLAIERMTRDARETCNGSVLRLWVPSPALLEQSRHQGVGNAAGEHGDALAEQDSSEPRQGAKKAAGRATGGGLRGEPKQVGRDGPEGPEPLLGSALHQQRAGGQQESAGAGPV